MVKTNSVRVETRMIKNELISWNDSSFGSLNKRFISQKLLVWEMPGADILQTCHRLGRGRGEAVDEA